MASAKQMKKLIESAKAIELPKALPPTVADLAVRQKRPTINNQPRVPEAKAEVRAEVKVNQYIRKESMVQLGRKFNTPGANFNF